MLYKRIIILLAGVTAVVAFWATTRLGQEREKTMQSGELPIIRVAIGRKITEVQAKSQLDFHLAEKNDDTPHVIEQPVVVEYDDPQLSMRLPATEFVWISQQAGVVTDVETSPHLEFLSLEEAHKLATQLADLIAGSRWSLNRRPPVDLNQIKGEVLNPDRYWTYERLYGEWSAGSVRLQLTLRESGRELPQELKSPPVFVVNVRFHDKALREKMQNLVYRTRKEVNGDINQPLPLNYHLSK